MKSKLQSLTRTIILLAVLTVPLLTTAAEIPTTASILSRIEKSTAKIKCFSAELYLTDLRLARVTNSGSVCLYFQTNNLDGTIASRTEIVSTNKWGRTNTTITIKNGEGMWILIKGKAIKMEFLGAQLAGVNQSLASFDPPKKNDLNTTVVEVDFEGIPSYLITETLNATFGDSIEAFVRNSGSKSSGIDPKMLLPVKQLYYVGIEDSFIYSIQKFNKDNVMISELTFRNVDKNPSLPGDTFSVSGETPTVIAHSLTEYVDTIGAIYAGNPTLKEKPTSTAARYGVLAIAIASASLVVFYLWKDLANKKAEEV